MRHTTQPIEEAIRPAFKFKMEKFPMPSCTQETDILFRALTDVEQKQYAYRQRQLSKRNGRLPEHVTTISGQARNSDNHAF